MKEETVEEEVFVSKNIPLEKITRDDCDSDEEWYFTCYLRELKENGVIEDADKNLEELELLERPITHLTTKYMKTKEKPEVQHLMGTYVYTPDFNINWNRDWRNIFYSMFNRGKQYSKKKVPFLSFSGKFDGSIIEVKGAYTKGTQMYSTNLKRAWLFDKRQIFVQLIKIPDLFELTFTPKEYCDDMIYKIGKNKGDSKIKFETKTCKEYLTILKKENERADVTPT